MTENDQEQVDDPMETFGTRLRAMRLAAGLSLPKFCRQTGLDSGNYSRIERGLIRPPQDHGKMEPIRAALGLGPEDDDWAYLLLLADMEWDALPRRLLKDERIRPLLPALLQELAGGRLTERRVEALTALIRAEPRTED